MSFKTEYQGNTQKKAKLVLPSGSSEESLRLILPDAPALSKEELIQQEFFVRTKQIINSPVRKADVKTPEEV